MGKNTLEDMIEDEVDNLIQNIEDHWIDVSVDPTLFFNIAVLASLWRVISGESLKVGDPKLKKLMVNVQNLLKEFSNPLSFIAFQSIPIAKIVHKLGILDFFNHTNNILDFCDSSLKSHSNKPIDGDNPLTFMEAFLHKIRTTNDSPHPFNGETGKLNLLNTAMDFFIGGSDTTANELNWAMLYMIQNPNIQSKVRQEIKSVIGSRGTKMSDRESTPYTEAVLLEVMRKGNITPLSLFHQTKL